MSSNWLFNWIAPVYDLFTWHHSYDVMSEALDCAGEELVVDLGGGTGAVTRRMIQSNPIRRGIVLDLSQPMLEQADGDVLDRVRGNGEEMPFRDNCIDRLLMTDSLHHMDSFQHVLREAKRVGTGGLLMVIEEFNPDTVLGKLIEWMEVGLGMGSQFRSPAELKKALEGTGFQCKDVREEGFVYYAILERSR